MTTSQTNSCANRAGVTEHNQTKNNNNRITNIGLQQEGVLKGVLRSGGTSVQISIDYSLFVAGLGLYASSKGYKMWSDVIKNYKLPEDSYQEVTRPEKTRLAQILTTQMLGANDQVINEKERITNDCTLEI